jgi:hypothetical protein
MKQDELVDEVIALRKENKRLRDALRDLLDCPAIAEGNHHDPEWECYDTVEAEREARIVLGEWK